MPKKVVFLSFSISRASVSDYFLALIDLFLKNGYKVVVFSDRKKPENLNLSSDIEIKYWRSKRPTTFRDAKLLYKEMKFYKPILTISVFGSVNLFLIVGFLSGVKHRVAWIRTLTTQFVQKKLFVARKALIYRLATQIVTNSNATMEDAIKNYKLSKDKIVVLPNSVKDFYNNVNINKIEDSKIIVYAGRLHYSKGVDTLIRAFNLIESRHSNIELVIFGSGPEENRLKQLVSKLNLNGKVFFRGSVPKFDVLTAFKSSYMAVVPSITEAFGFTVIEAMSMKTLVIGANNTGIKEIILPNKTGLLFETRDYFDLANKLSLAIENVTLRDQLAAAGYVRFLECFEIQMAIRRDFLFFKKMK